MQSQPTEGLWDKTIGSSLSSLGTADERVQRGSTRAVRDSDGSRELDEVTRGHVAVLLEGLEESDDLVETLVRVERGLDGGELYDGAVSTSTTVQVGFQCTDRKQQNVLSTYPNLPCASRAGEKAMASWKERRKASWATSLH